MVAYCSSLLAQGVCHSPGCTSNHDIHICRPCGVVCHSTLVHQAHLSGRRHKKKLTGRVGVVHCPLCDINLGNSSWKSHVQGRRHRRSATLQSVNPDIEPEEETVKPGHTFCNVCGRAILDGRWEHHLSSIKHVKRMLFAKYEAAFEEAEKNKHGMTVSHLENGVDFGIVEVEDAQHGVSIVLSIENTVPVSSITLVNVKLALNPRPGIQPFFVMLPSVQKVVSGRPVDVRISFRSSYRGRYRDRVEIMFEDTVLHRTFVIVRQVTATVGNQEDHEALKPIAPYVPRKRGARDPEREVIEGVPPPALRAIPYVVRLPEAEIPERISIALSRGSVESTTTYFRTSALPQVMDSATHGRYMKTLLWIEEFRMERDLQIYDIPDAQLTNHNRYYYLPVPGLAEKRPSVLVGDRIMVQPHGSDKGRWFEGHVHVVHRDEVGLCFHSSFPYEITQRYNVRFKLNRIPLRRQHQALDTAFDPDRVLFPSQQHFKSNVAPSTTIIQAYIYNRLLLMNPPQLQAVASIAMQPQGSPPFVVFGPPGTGKTITVVESIRQVLRVNPRARVLACAPSNSAADIIASRLAMLGTDELFRFYAPSRHDDQVPDELRNYIYKSRLNSDGRDHFSVPPIAVLKRFRVVVSTCVSASVAHGVGLPRGHFTHVFIDEAGQATEPEVMIALRTMADNDTNIVLSGDPKQLGPIVRSAVARDLGFEKSYIERLMERGPYDEISGRGISVVKLVQNFRSHASILQFPNERFYRGDLQVCGSRTVIDAFIGSSILIAKKFPVIMHAISGQDNREASSPSFFNIDEVLQVKEYVQALRSMRDIRISDSEIGIIAPYNAQCRKIRVALKGIADDVKVGSVEEFQGQERKVIIISAVRSSREFVEYDLKHTLGFVANPRRFNVAVTRAQALLIVIGDPEVLALDPLWRSFLNYIHQHGGWTGNEPTWDTEAPVDSAGGYDQAVRENALADMNEFARMMERMTLQWITDEGEDDANVDRPWREVE